MGITRFRGRQIEDNTVTSADITDHTITADDIAAGSLDGAMFVDGSIPAEKFDLTSFPGPGLSLVLGQFAVNVDDVDLEIVADVLKTTTLVTKQGNTFNLPNMLVQLDGTGHLPVNALYTQDLLDVTGTVNTADGLVLLDMTGKLPALDGSALTNLSISEYIATSDLYDVEGAVNTANGLVKLDGSGLLPALDGSALTSLSSAGANTQVQFNSSGSFGASSDLTWDSGLRRLFVIGDPENEIVRISDNINSTLHVYATASPAQGMRLSADNSLAFAINYVDAMTVTLGGNVGIGTAAPQELLHVKGPILVEGPTGFANYVANSGGIDHAGNDLRIVSRGPDGLTNGGFVFLSTASDGSNIFSPVEIDAAGLVGINRQPSGSFFDGPYHLQVQGSVLSVGDAGAGAFFRASGFGIGPAFTSARANGTEALPTNTLDGDSMMFIGAKGHDGTAYSPGSRAAIFMDATEDFTPTAQGTKIRFRVTAPGSVANTQNVLTLMAASDNVPLVGIGTQNPSSTLHVVGSAQIANETDPSKVLTFDSSGQAASTTVTISPLSAASTVFNIQPNVDATANLITQNAVSGQVFIGANSTLHTSNAGIQYSDATTANRGQIKLHSYFAGASIAGVSTVTSRSGVIGVGAAVVGGQEYSKWTAQAGATTPGSMPISGSWAFKANTVNSLTVSSDFELKLTNLAGTLATALFVNSEGMVGIGTITPSSGLDVVGSVATASRINVTNTNDTDSVGLTTTLYRGIGSTNVSGLFMRSARGTSALPTASQDGDVLGLINAKGYDGTVFPSGAVGQGARITMDAVGAWSGSNRGASIRFSTALTGTITGVVDRMVIKDSGFIGIGTTAPLGILDIRSGTSFTVMGLSGGQQQLVVGFSSAPVFPVEANLVSGGSMAASSGSGSARVGISSSGIEASTVGSELRFRVNRGPSSSRVAVEFGDAMARFTVSGYGGQALNAMPTATDFLRVFASETHTTTASGRSLSLLTTENLTTTAVPRLFIEHNGNVGIGTVIPTRALSVDGGAVVNQAVFGQGRTGITLQQGNSGIAFNSYYNAGQFSMASGYTGLLDLDNSTGDFHLYTGTNPGAADSAATFTERFTVLNTGNVGIGTSTPNQKLDVAGNIQLSGALYIPTAGAPGPAISFVGDGNTGIFSPGADTFGVSTGGTERLRIDSTGKVGIGGAATFATLDVQRTTGVEIIHMQNQAATGFGWMLLHQVDGSLSVHEQSVGNHLNISAGGSAEFTGALTVTGQLNLGADADAGGYKVRNAADPLLGDDLATKQYVDSLANGLSLKASVRVATTASITLSGAQTIDTIPLTGGERVLVKDQSLPEENGIYVVVDPGAWTRSTDADNTPGSEVNSGMYTFVQDGSANINNGYVLVTQDPITLGVTPLTFSIFAHAPLVEFVDRETPSGAMDSSNVTYTLAYTPILGSEHLYKNGILQDEGAGNGYTISGDTITMTTAPTATDKLRISYRK